jgi:hypothetical protein
LYFLRFQFLLLFVLVLRPHLALFGGRLQHLGLFGGRLRDLALFNVRSRPDAIFGHRRWGP